MTTFYKCENCDHVSDDIDQIDLNEWASCQDQADVYGLPAGTCTECGAPVYEEGTFNKLDAARELIHWTHVIIQRLEESNGILSETENTEIELARAAVTRARAAFITPAPLTK